MNKLFTLAVAVLASGTLSANAETVYLMKSKSDPMYAESYEFTYDNDNRLVRIDASNEDEYYRELVYDADGRLTGDLCYQYLYLNDSSEGEWRFVNRSEYRYDEAGHLVVRLVVNDHPTEGILLAAYRYTYDDNGRLSKRYTIYPESIDDPCDKVDDAGQIVTYMYDENGRLIQEEDIIKSMFYDEENTIVARYYYDGKDRVVVRQELTNGVPYLHEVNLYDKDGNLTEIYKVGSVLRFDFDTDGNLVVNDEPTKASRNVYTYTDVPASQCVYPINEEDFIESAAYRCMTRQLEMEEVWSRADDGNIYPTNNWEYEWIEGNPAGIETVSPEVLESFVAYVSGDELKFIGNNEHGNVRIFDTNGRLVKQVLNVKGSVNVAGLANGVYVVATPSGIQKFVR